MPKVELLAGATLDFLDKKEAKEAFVEALVETYRGVRFVNRPGIGIVGADGLLTIAPPDFGPDGGFTWAVTRISGTAVTAEGDQTTETLNLHVNEVAPSRFVSLVELFDVPLLFGRFGLVLNPDDRLIFTGASLTEGLTVAVTIAAVEIPNTLNWTLL